jgi:hypothetical protein
LRHNQLLLSIPNSVVEDVENDVVGGSPTANITGCEPSLPFDTVGTPPLVGADPFADGPLAGRRSKRST